MLDFLKKPSENKENFWALLIEPEWIASAIWQVTDGKVEIVSISPATRWESTNDESKDNLIEVIDTSLSACTQNLADDVPDPTKTVFGVPNLWISEGNIKPEYLVKLKKICTDLSLIPSGFVVLSEAISHYIKQDEESPLTGIVVGISNEDLDLSIFNSGKLSGTTSVMRSISIEEDMTEGLSRLGGALENFPSRIILFNQKEQELEEIKSNLDAIDWNKLAHTKFIHTPRVEILDSSKKILAVALAGGSELGEVNGIIENLQESDTKTEEIPLEEVNNIEVPDQVTATDLGFTTSLPKLPIFPKLNNIVASFAYFKLSHIKIPNFKLSLRGKPLIIGISTVATILIVGFISWWFLPKATVTIYVSPQKLEENITLTVGNDIKNESIEVNVTGEKTISTSGTKVVGEKAKGSVKIQNGTAFPINLPSGTVLVSSSDLKFVTTKSASVSGALSPSSPGNATLDVEAGSIGSEYNLTKDEVFKVGNYPKAEVDGTSTDTFSGGSSRQISAVSEEDKKKVLEELTEELFQDAKVELNNKIIEDMFLVDASLKAETVEEEFSNKVGDEATNLKLNLSLKITSTIVSKKELSEISTKSLEGKVPTGFVLRDDQVTYGFSIPDEDGKFDVRIFANLLPSIDTTVVAKQIAGRYPKIAEEYIANIPGFVNAEIRMIPTLKGKLGTLPHVSKNIDVMITAEK